MIASYVWHCFSVSALIVWKNTGVYYISALSCHTAPVGQKSVGSKTKSIRPRLRPRPKLQDQDQDQDQKYKTKTEAGLRLVLFVIRPRSQTPRLASIRICPIFPETRVIGVHFCRCMYGSVFIQICAVGSKRHIFSAPESNRVCFGRSSSSKVDDFGTNQKRICDFLLVCHCKCGSILHHLWDTVIYWLKIAYFSYPTLIRRPRSLCSLWNFAVKLTMRKLESWGYTTVKTAWS